MQLFQVSRIIFIRCYEVFTIIIQMNIQKKKFISSLARITIFRKAHPSVQRFSYAFHILQTLAILNFMVIHTNVELLNPVFIKMKEIHKELYQDTYLVYVYSSLLTVICIFFVCPLIILSQKQQRVEIQDQKTCHQRILLKIAGVFSFIFDYIAPILLITIISGIKMSNLSSVGDNLFHFFCLFLSQIIIVVCKSQILYSQQLIFLLFFLSLLPSFSVFIIILGISLYNLKTNKNERVQQTCYLLIALLASLLIIGEQTQTCIGTMDFILLIVLLLVNHILLPKDHNLQTIQDQNAFLLKVIDKLFKDKGLKWSQSMKIIEISQKLQMSNQKNSIFNIDSEILSKLNQKKTLKIQDIIKLLKAKIELQLKMHPNNINLFIQKYQCQLLYKPFSISTLYQIQKLGLEVQSRNELSETLRIQSLINQIEVKFLKIDDEINSSLIFIIQKKIERFYTCIGEGIEELLALWKIIKIKKVSEDMFDNSISKMLCLENESLKILDQLGNYKNMSFQKQILNYWRKITNISITNYYDEDQLSKKGKFFETKFLLISNNIIQDSSHTIAKKITLDHQDSLKGLNISQILYDFYNKFLENELNNIISIRQNQKQILIPYKIVNHDKRFLPFSCSFKILPFISQGIKYIINFIDRKQDNKNYVIYCMQSDTIQGFSDTFFQKYNIDQDLLPEVLSGQQIFGTAVSTYFMAQTLSRGQQIKCELKFHDLRKNIKGARIRRNSIPLMLTIRDVYNVNSLNFVLFELNSREQTAILSASQTIKQFVALNRDDHPKTPRGELSSHKFCKIPNPFESTIDDKLSRINNTSRISYFKVVLMLLLTILIILGGTFIFFKLDIQNIGMALTNQINVLDNTYNIVSTIYLLFYQYYQYYQIKNYPKQLLDIQYYNMTAQIKSYYKKTDTNIVQFLPLILKNDNPQFSLTYKLKFSNYEMLHQTKIINFVEFLDNTKMALKTNNPIFLVENYDIIYTIFESFVELYNEPLKQFRYRLQMFCFIVIGVIILICLIIRLIQFRITLFKWKILKVYPQITQNHITNYTRKLEQFLHLMINIKYYSRQSIPAKPNRILIKGFSIKQTFGQEITHFRSGDNIQNEESGIQSRTLCTQLLNNNLTFIIPLIIGAYFLIYYNLADTYQRQADTVLNYFQQLQNLTVLMLDKATSFFQSSMEAFLLNDKNSDIKKAIFKVPTRIHIQLPSFFDNYKNKENAMLNYNMCDYSYLNTGSLYKGINCSKILDGIMNKGFTQTYSFLVQKIQKYIGIAMPDLGKQFRPAAQYPFFMEICYARRTINNMLVALQTEFVRNIKDFLSVKQNLLERIIGVGFLILPSIFFILFIIFTKKLREECERVIKCFRILPRSFIMQIKTSKKLSEFGILNEVELVAI